MKRVWFVFCASMSCTHKNWVGLKVLKFRLDLQLKRKSNTSTIAALVFCLATWFVHFLKLHELSFYSLNLKFKSVPVCPSLFECCARTFVWMYKSLWASTDGHGWIDQKRWSIEIRLPINAPQKEHEPQIVCSAKQTWINSYRSVYRHILFYIIEVRSYAYIGHFINLYELKFISLCTTVYCSILSYKVQ